MTNKMRKARRKKVMDAVLHHCKCSKEQNEAAGIVATGKGKPDCAPRTGSVAHPGVWCCERRGQCKWKCYALEAAGLQWGTPDQVTPEWLKWHKRECGGRLVQLVPPNAAGSATPDK